MKTSRIQRLLILIFLTRMLDHLQCLPITYRPTIANNRPLRAKSIIVNNRRRDVNATQLYDPYKYFTSQKHPVVNKRSNLTSFTNTTSLRIVSIRVSSSVDVQQNNRKVYAKPLEWRKSSEEDDAKDLKSEGTDHNVSVVKLEPSEWSRKLNQTAHDVKRNKTNVFHPIKPLYLANANELVAVQGIDESRVIKTSKAIRNFERINEHNVDEIEIERVVESFQSLNKSLPYGKSRDGIQPRSVSYASIFQKIPKNVGDYYLKHRDKYGKKVDDYYHYERSNELHRDEMVEFVTTENTTDVGGSTTEEAPTQSPITSSFQFGTGVDASQTVYTPMQPVDPQVPEITPEYSINWGEPERNYEVNEETSVLSNGRVHGVQSETNHSKVGFVVEGDNFRKYRVEERTSDGFIVGEYGVVKHDDGTLRGVRYTADGTINPKLIYEALLKFINL